MDRAHSVSESELRILRVIWAHGGEVMLSPLMDDLIAQGVRWKTNTVLTFLSRLCEKELVRIDKMGRLNRYTARISEEEYMSSLTRAFISDVYGGDAKGLIASLFKSERLSKQDIDELQSFWEEARKDE